jgi:adenylate cyclase
MSMNSAGANASKSAAGYDPVMLQRKSRIVSGLILFTYVLTHLLNDALGLWSLSALEAGREVFLGFWHSPLSTISLYGAMIVHIGLAFWALYKRDSFAAMTWVEWLQMVLGFSVPLMLAAYLMGTRAAHEVFDLAGSYKFTLMIFWVFLPYLLWLQPIALLAAWGHGCLGLHQWLRFKPA